MTTTTGTRVVDDVPAHGAEQRGPEAGAPVRADDDEIRLLALRDERLAGVALDELALDLDAGFAPSAVDGTASRTTIRAASLLRAQLACKVARRNRQHPGVAHRLRWDERPRVHGDEPRLPQRCLLGGPAERLV